MVDELALSPETLVVAHGTTADALLRFVENRQVRAVSYCCHNGVWRTRFNRPKVSRSIFFLEQSSVKSK